MTRRPGTLTPPSMGLYLVGQTRAPGVLSIRWGVWYPMTTLDAIEDLCREDCP